MGSYDWKKDDFDSGILRFNCAKIFKINSPKFIKSLINDLKVNKIEYAICRVKLDNIEMIQKLEESGFVMVDGSVALCVDLKEKQIYDTTVREAQENDRSDLQRIASTSFERTRFFNDPLIQNKYARNIYKEWINNSLDKIAADKVYVIDSKKSVIGFVTVKENHIVLIAVDKKNQGKGIGKKLVRFVLADLSKRGFDCAFIETQENNIGALRAYQGCGFKIINSFVTLRIHLSQDKNTTKI